MEKPQTPEAASCKHQDSQDGYNRVYIGGYVAIMEGKMETTIVY